MTWDQQPQCCGHSRRAGQSPKPDRLIAPRSHSREHRSCRHCGARPCRDLDRGFRWGQSCAGCRTAALGVFVVIWIGVFVGGVRPLGVSSSRRVPLSRSGSEFPLGTMSRIKIFSRSGGTPKSRPQSLPETMAPDSLFLVRFGLFSPCVGMRATDRDSASLFLVRFGLFSPCVGMLVTDRDSALLFCVRFGLFSPCVGMYVTDRDPASLSPDHSGLLRSRPQSLPETTARRWR